MRSRSTLLAGGTALAAAALSVALIAPATADIAPNSTDIVGVGSDTVQNMMNFIADGDPLGNSAGINAVGGQNRLFSFDATPDANDRAGYLNGSAASLNATIILRAGTNPVQRPQGSGAGLKAIIADTIAPFKINYTRSSRLPTVAEQNSAIAAGFVGGLHVVKISTDKLVMAAANITNAPAALTINQVLDIYKCLPTADDFGNDVAVGGTAGGVSTGAIIPIAPQTQSGTYGSFKANLDTANGSPVTLGTCVRFAEEHDPAAITTSLVPANAISPFSEGRFNLYASSYFKDPNVVFPGGAAITSGVKLLTGVGSYVNNRGLYVVFRDADKNSPTKWQPGSSLNFVQALFLNTAPAPYVKGLDAQGAIAAGGGVPTYADCGAGPTVTTC